jgi:hypothetical protein
LGWDRKDSGVKGGESYLQFKKLTLELLKLNISNLSKGGNLAKKILNPFSSL